MLKTIRQTCVAVSGDVLLTGQCIRVALIVQAAMGGELIRGSVDGWMHFWNRLPDGSEVDLTSSQFGGDGMTPLGKCGVAIEKPDPVPVEHLAFVMRVLRHLERRAE